MSVPFPSPTSPAASRTAVFLRYLDYFRDQLTGKLALLPAAELRSSRLPSGWTPLELLKHLRHVERRWLEWGFCGQDVGDPWADWRDDRWYVGPAETVDSLTAELTEQAARSRAIIESHDLAEVGEPGPRWDGAGPATLERVLFHLVQEYARHIGHLDIVTELAVGAVSEDALRGALPGPGSRVPGSGFRPEACRRRSLLGRACATTSHRWHVVAHALPGGLRLTLSVLML